MDNLIIKVISIPCHTKGSVAYYVTSKNSDKKAVFTGETLFLGGCGRFFEGTAEEMLKNVEKLSLLPDDTKVYSGHDYGLQNMRFALSVDKNNHFVKQKLEQIKKLKELCDLKRSKSSDYYEKMVSTISEEKMFNPFMRTTTFVDCKNPNMKSKVLAMKFLRSCKNKFV